MTRSRPVELLLVLAAACGKGDAPAKIEPPPAPKVEAPPPPAPHRDLKTLKVTAPAGWTAEYADSDQWIFEGRPNADQPSVIARINYPDRDVPRTADAYIAHEIEAFWDKGSTAEVVEQQPRPGGFAATYSVRAAVDPDHPKLEYRAIWDLGGEILRCECMWLPDEAVRDTVRALCDSAAW